MPRTPKSRRGKQSKPKKKLNPTTVFIFSVTFGMLGYLLGEFVFGFKPHPFHWLAGIAVVIAGYLFGLGVFRRYGDFFGW